MKPYFDFLSLFIYLSVAFIGTVCIKQIIAVNSEKKYEESSFFNAKISFVILFLMWTSLAVGREYNSNGIGGIDTYRYVENFCFDSLSDRFKDVDWLFRMYTKFIRNITSNYLFYFFISYSIIVYSYILVCKTYGSSKVSVIPMICLIYPYLHSFNTFRSSLAIALFAIGLCKLNNSKVKGLFFIICSIYFHRMMILAIPLLFFMFAYKNKMYKYKQWKLIVGSTFLVIIITLIMKRFQIFVISNELISGTDKSYLSSSISQNILSRYPMYFAHICLLVVMSLAENHVVKDEKYIFVKTICIYDIIFIIPSVVLGVWRFNEIFYPFRLIMWGYLIYGLRSKYPNYSFAINLSSVIISIAWLVFRISSTCQDAGYMPYIFNWFGLFK